MALCPPARCHCLVWQKSQELGTFGSETAPFRGPEGTCFGVSRETAASGAVLGSVLNSFWAPRCPQMFEICLLFWGLLLRVVC